MKMAKLILLTIGMHIMPTKLLEVSLLNAEYDLEGRLYEGYNGADLVDDD